MRRTTVLASLALLATASAAYAHPKLLSASPARNAAVATLGRIEMHFSEKLMAKFSGADLMMTGMKGMTHAPMKVAGVTKVAPDGRTLVITPKKPLGAGSYNVAWHVVSVDTHRVAGNYAFAVK